MTVIYVVLGLVGFFVITSVIGVLLFIRSETGQRIIGTVGKGYTVFQEASNAPGTKELRAFGCSRAMVIPFDKLADIMRGISPDAAREIDRERLPGNGTMVLCQVMTDEKPAPACADVAREYARAVPTAPERFGVTVQQRNKSTCDGKYTRDGTFIEPMQTRYPGRDGGRTDGNSPVEKPDTP
jgi:hypothetical protein